jgi:anionic cell wall polymer biosynthesis LytR-Cps2A-Psr (LCP) family protein
LETIAEWSKIYPDRIVIVAGRGEAFREYVIRNELRSVYNEIRIPNLYLGDESLMSWYVNDYVRFRYKSESDTSKVKRSSELLHGLKELIKKHSFTRNFLYPGSLGNFALDNVRYSNQDEQRLEALMFQTLIERNRKTHNRPGKGDTEL